MQINVDSYATSFWDEIEGMWESEAGTYEVLVGTSSDEIVARGQFTVEQTRYWTGV